MDLFELAEARAQTAKQAAREEFQPDECKRDTLRRDVLDALKAGPRTTLDLIEVGGHRFSTSIDELRKAGHVIATEFGENRTAIYSWRGFNPRCVVTREMQAAYYETPHWKAVAYARKELDYFRCVQCHSVEELETHHWVYPLFAEVVGVDLITLCRECHKRLHSRVNIHFPKFVSDEIAERLTCPQA